MPTNESYALDLTDQSAEQCVHRLIEFAAQLQASDLFFLADETRTHISVRHLGVMQSVAHLPHALGKRCLAHIKAMASMDVAEHRRPQDGRWLQEIDGRHIDLRINTIPTLFGEDFTIRLLARDSILLRLEGLGMVPREYNDLLKLIDCPSGLILVTGPTGSGKTTTLYACLNHLNNGQRKINTIEDPIEYTLKGVRQSQVNPRLDLNFPELLRSVLRQAPDVIMIGEIRDAQTAETAVRAANSGHLVLATLHAPIAAGAVQSMLSLGVHPHFLASSLRGVLAQRLLRTLCPRCRATRDPALTPHFLEEMQQRLQPGQGPKLYAKRGCEHCRGTGYMARTGVFEVMTVRQEVRRLIMQNQPTQAMRAQAMEKGMIDIRQAALLCVLRGETTLEEVMHVIPPEYLGTEH